MESRPTATSATNAKIPEILAAEKVLTMGEERRRKKMKLNAALKAFIYQSTNPRSAPTMEPTDMYLILPSYAEIIKAEINNILAKFC